MNNPFIIKIPSTLSPDNALWFANRVKKNTPAVESYCYDFSNLQHCPPFGLLVVLNAIQYNRNRFFRADHYMYPSLDLEGKVSITISNGVKYACHLGFFQHCGWDEGRKTGLGNSTNNCIPITKITNSVLEEYEGEGPHLLDRIEAFSHLLALRLTRDQNDDLTKLLNYVFREIIRNTFEHSETSAIWVCGQFWPQRHRAEIALMDQGCGIKGSLSKNANYKLENDMTANLLALEPGVSQRFGEKEQNDYYQNSGFGLYVAKSFGKKWGTFILASGNHAFFINPSYSEGKNIDTNIKGTCVYISLDTNRIKDVSVSIENIIHDGESIARAQEGRIKTASKTSSSLFLK